MSVHKIIIEIKGKEYGILNLGYDKNGGYFIVDLSTVKKTYYITKLKFRLPGPQVQMVPIDKGQEWITEHKPKLMHHTDGSTHISGTGIKSGFYKTTGKPKGVMTSSPNFNDGGPIFTFLFWGLEKFDTRGKKGIIIKDKLITSEYPEPIIDIKRQGYLFEGYYLPIEKMSLINKIENTISINHPNLGRIILTCIPPPPNSPGFIALACRKAEHGLNDDHGFTYSGGVTVRDEDGYNYQIQIMYPFDGQFKKDFGGNKIKNLHFNFKFKMIYYIDDVISLIKKIYHTPKKANLY